MPIRRSAKIPEAILHLQQQLEQWRGAQKGRAKLPESFWQAAVDLAKQYGVFRTAQPLRLDYTRLKQRLLGAAPQRKSPRPAIVELVRPPSAREGCIIEFESAQGAKMRVQWSSSVPPDWTNLLRAWRDGDR
jgi:D-alanyl-D-alanine carboxypeptidase